MRYGLGRIAWVIGSSGATAAAYLLFLGWNEKKYLRAEEPGAVGTECAGPHEPWHVVALAGVLAVLVVAGSWLSHPMLVTTPAAITLTTLFTVDAVTVDDPCADNALLPIGVTLLAIGSTIAGVVLAAFTSWMRRRRGPDQSHGILL